MANNFQAIKFFCPPINHRITSDIFHVSLLFIKGRRKAILFFCLQEIWIYVPIPFGHNLKDHFFAKRGPFNTHACCAQHFYKVFKQGPLSAALKARLRIFKRATLLVTSRNRFRVFKPYKGIPILFGERPRIYFRGKRSAVGRNSAIWNYPKNLTRVFISFYPKIIR